MFNLDQPSLPCVPGALRASSLTASVSYPASYDSAGMDQSRFAGFTFIPPVDSVDSIFGDDPDLEPLPRFYDAAWDGLTDEQRKLHSLVSKAQYAIASLDSVDSIFGDDPDLEPLPRLSDPVAWDGLTDEQRKLNALISKAESAIADENWKLRSLMSKAENAIREAEIGIMKTLDNSLLVEDLRRNGDLFETEGDLDAVATVRAGLMNGDQTLTRPAMDVIDGQPVPVASWEGNYSATHEDMEVAGTDDYTTDFEIGDDALLLRVRDALRASFSTTSVSSASSHDSIGLDQHSNSSQSTDMTVPITPVDSVHLIFRDGPDLESLPHFSVAGDGLSDDEWEAECAIVDEHWKQRFLMFDAKEAELAILLASLEEDLQLFETDGDFDAVAAVRANPVKGEQTITTRHALDIIDSWVPHHPVVDVMVEIEDYAADFELGDLEVPLTLNSNDRRYFIDPTLGAIEEVDESMEQVSMPNQDTFASPFRYATDLIPSTPMIRPVDVVLDRSASSILHTSVSTADSAFRLIMSPLILDRPAFIPSAVFHNSFKDVGPPNVFFTDLFGGGLSVPTSVARYQNCEGYNVSLWATMEGIRTDHVPSSSCVEPPPYKFHQSRWEWPECIQPITSGIHWDNSETWSLPVDPRFAPSYDVPAFEPAEPPWEIPLDGLTNPTSTEIRVGLPEDDGSYRSTQLTQGYTATNLPVRRIPYRRDANSNCMIGLTRLASRRCPYDRPQHCQRCDGYDHGSLPPCCLGIIRRRRKRLKSGVVC